MTGVVKLATALSNSAKSRLADLEPVLVSYNEQKTEATFPLYDRTLWQPQHRAKLLLFLMWRDRNYESFFSMNISYVFKYKFFFSVAILLWRLYLMKSSLILISCMPTAYGPVSLICFIINAQVLLMSN